MVESLGQLQYKRKLDRLSQDFFGISIFAGRGS